MLFREQSSYALVHTIPTYANKHKKTCGSKALINYFSSYQILYRYMFNPDTLQTGCVVPGSYIFIGIAYPQICYYNFIFSVFYKYDYLGVKRFKVLVNKRRPLNEGCTVGSLGPIPVVLMCVYMPLKLLPLPVFELDL